MVVSFGLIVKEGDRLISCPPGDVVDFRTDLAPGQLEVLRDKYGDGASLIVAENGYVIAVVGEDGRIYAGSLMHIHRNLFRHRSSEKVHDPITDDDLCRLLSYTVG